MSNPGFEIKLRPHGSRLIYKMRVEITYQSKQVIRFTITGGAKEIKMEKLLLKKTYPWKITSSNFKLEGNPKEIAMSMAMMQDEIDYYIKKI